MQTRAVIAGVVTTYDISLPDVPGTNDFERSGKDRYLMVYGPLWVRLVSRGKNAKVTQPISNLRWRSWAWSKNQGT